MSDSILAVEDKLDHKLELEHIPITRMAATNFDRIITNIC